MRSTRLKTSNLRGYPSNGAILLRMCPCRGSGIDKRHFTRYHEEGGGGYSVV